MGSHLENLLSEAKLNLTTFEDIVLEESSDKNNRQVEYHQVSTIQPTVNDLNHPEGIFGDSMFVELKKN